VWVATRKARDSGRESDQEQHARERKRGASSERCSPRALRAELVGELSRELCRRTKIGVRIALQVVANLSDDPAPQRATDPYRSERASKLVRVTHASTASIAAVNARH